MRKELWITLYPIGYRVAYAWLLAGVLIFGIGEILGIGKFEIQALETEMVVLQQTGFLHMAYAMGAILLLAWMNFGKIKGKILGIVAFIFYGMGVSISMGTYTVESFWKQYFLWLVGRSGYNVEWQMGYELIQVLWIAVCSYILSGFLEKWQRLKSISVIGMLAGICIGMLAGENISQWGMIAVLGYVLMAVMEITREHWNKKQERNNREYIMWMVPFVLVYMVLLSQVPQQTEPYDWKFLREMYGKLDENFTIWMETIKREDAEVFQFSMEGFSEESSPMADLLQSDKEYMKIQGDRGLTTSIYLTGQTKNVFDGREWSQGGKYVEDEILFDTIETFYGIKRYADAKSNDYIQMANATIRYSFFDTKYLFAPLKLTGITGRSVPDYIRDDGEVVFDRQMGYGTEYEVSFYQMNRKDADFMNLVTAVRTDRESDNSKLWENAVKSHTTGDKKNYTLKDLDIYRQAIKEKYYEEVQLPQEVEQYVESITKGCATDLECLQAIERELSAMEYTRAPGKLPEWVQSEEEFLEYFLLESKRGFCSHFATSFVLLARAEGFPARYVEGFVVPLKKDKEMTVTSDMVHAWPEVYIERFGWIAFEPTPGYGSLCYGGWKTADETESMDGEEQEATDITYGENPDLDAENFQIDRVEEIAIQKQRSRQIFQIVGYGIGILCILCIVIWIMERILRRYRYRHMTVEQQFLVEIRCNLKLLTLLGGRRMENQTLQEWIEILYLLLPQYLVVGKNSISIEMYQKYLYGNLGVTGELLQQLIAERKRLLIWTKQEKRAVYCRIRLYMFLSG